MAAGKTKRKPVAGSTARRKAPGSRKSPIKLSAKPPSDKPLAGTPRLQSALIAADMPLAVIILAAGQGRRMRSNLPKVLQPLAGRPLLSHVIDTARELSPAAIHVVYGHGGDAVRERLSTAPVQWVLQADQLGTGHAVLQAAPQLHPDQRVLILYGDVPLLTPATLRQLLEGCGPDSLALLTVEMDDPSGYGRIIRDTRGRVRRIVEEEDASPRERAVRECNTGVMAVPARHLVSWLRQLRSHNAQGEYYLTDVIAAAVKDGVAISTLIVQSEDEVQGVNDKVQLSMAEATYRLRQAVALMQAGVTVIDPLRLDVRGTVEAGRDVQIDVNVVLEGRVKLGDGARIGPNCVLREVEVGPGTELLPNCVLERAVIGADCRIGPFTRIRPETVLADRVHLGNFVEVKKSRVGTGSKANHLTYLGDTEVGAAVNVGAGTITCNYDGANKFPTTIGDGAFIGSGSMLVAPVTIGANATIGAGSTITRDAPAGQLTLERSKQVTVKGWQRPKKR